MKRYFHFLLMGLASVLFYACGSTEERTLRKQDTIPVKLMGAEQIETGQSIVRSGTFTTDDETLLSFKTGGTIEELYVKAGDQVRQGQLLARINPTEISSSAEQAKLGLEKARRDFERAKRLYQDSVATLEQMQNAETAFKVAAQQARSADYNLGQAEMRASGNGYVLNRLANVGQTVGPGTPVLQVNGAGKGRWFFNSGLSDRQWALVQIGDSASISTDIPGSEAIPARVVRKSEAIDPASGTFSIQLEVLQPAKGIASGLFGKAKIQLREVQKGWKIPYSAVLDSDGEEAFVFVTEDKKVARKQRVKISALEQDWVIISGGLKPGTALIVSGSAYLTDGDPIRIVE